MPHQWICLVDLIIATIVSSSYMQKHLIQLIKAFEKRVLSRRVAPILWTLTIYPPRPIKVLQEYLSGLSTLASSQLIDIHRPFPFLNQNPQRSYLNSFYSNLTNFYS